MVNVTIILHDYNDIWHACLWGNDSLFSLLQQHSVLISMHVKLYEVFMKQHLPQVISKLETDNVIWYFSKW